MARIFHGRARMTRSKKGVRVFKMRVWRNPAALARAVISAGVLNPPPSHGEQIIREVDIRDFVGGWAPPTSARL